MAHILIVAATFYDDIAAELIAGTKTHLDSTGASYDVVNVPGAFEIPAGIRFAMQSKAQNYDGYIALGCVIRGETSHYDYVCSESARGLNELAMHHKAAIGYGILTVENREQAIARAAQDQGNKGKAAAEACLHMITLKSQFGVAS